MLFLLFNSTRSFSQLILSTGQTVRQSIKAEDIWQVSIKNPTGMAYTNAEISFQFTNETKDTVLSSHGIIPSLNMGDINLTSALLFNITYRDTKDSVNAQPVINKGTYEVCYKITSNTYTILGEQCFPITVLGEDTLKKQSGVFKVFGSGTLTRFDSFGSDTRPANPINYSQATGSIGVSLFDIPANVSFVVNQTGNSFDLKDSRISFGFDAQAVKESLTKKAKDRLLKEQSKLNFDLLNNKNSLAELTNLNEMFSNKDVLKELQQLSELDSIEKLLKQDSNLVSFQGILIGKKDSINQKAGARWDSSGVKVALDSAIVITDSVLAIKDAASDSIGKYADLIKDTKGSVTDSLQELARLDSYKKLLDRYKELKFLKEKKASYEKLLARKKELEKRLEQAKQTIDKGKEYVSDGENLYDDPTSIRKYIEHSKYFSPLEKILYQIKTLRIGNLMPQFSNFTLTNIPITGFQLEVTPYNTYEGFVTGRVAKPSGLLNQPAGERKITALGVGYGQNETSNLRLYYLKSNDKDNPADTTYKPQLNQVLSIVGKINVVKNYFAIETELAGSETVNDKRLASVNDANGGNKNFFTSIFSQETNDINKGVGYAISSTAKISAFKKATDIGFGFKKISSGFRTHGNPYLINNNTILELKASQSILKNKIMLGGLVQRVITAPDNPGAPSMKMYQYGGELGLAFNKLPVLRVSYQPLVQLTDTLQIRTTILNSNLSYSFRTGKVRHQSNLNYLRQVQTGLGQVFSSSITALQSIIFKDNSLLSLQYGYYENEFNGINTQSHIATLGYSTLFFKKLNTTAGVSFNYGNSERKIGGKLEFGYPLGKYLGLGLRAERNVYNNFIPTAYTLTNYQEWLLRTWLNFKF